MSSYLHNVQTAGPFKSLLRAGQHICVSTWDAPIVFNFPDFRDFFFLINMFLHIFKRYYEYFDLNWTDWSLIRSNLVRIWRKYYLSYGRILMKFPKTLVCLDYCSAWTWFSSQLPRLVFKWIPSEWVEIKSGCIWGEVQQSKCENLKTTTRHFQIQIGRNVLKGFYFLLQ